MSGTWSERIEQQYCLRLPRDVRAWLDQEVWQQPGGAEFCRARTPEQWLDPEPGTIWSGFMLPDTLPIIGNDYGDWLCLRCAADGTVSELVHWSHCGGDWIPCGASLAEALLYDAAQRVMDPRPPGFTGESLPDHQVFRLAQWALPWITPEQSRSTRDPEHPLPHRHMSLQGFWDRPNRRTGHNSSVVLDLLLDWRVAEFAVRRDRILRYLESPLKTLSNPTLAQQLGVSWEPDFVRWLFDTRQIPPSVCNQLCQQIDADGRDLVAQDWDAAEREATLVIQRRNDLGWAFDVAGWAAQRRGDWALAVQHYLAGLRTSWFSDDTVRFRTHWFEEGYGKFAASRLATLTGHLPAEQRSDPYLIIFLDNDPQSLRRRVHAYWMELAQESERLGEHAQAYQCYYRAGWDLGLHPLSEYVEVFEGLCRTAKAARMPALAAIARMHQQFLVEAQ